MADLSKRSVDDRLDIAKAVGLWAELRQAQGLVTDAPDVRHQAKGQLDQTLTDYVDVMARLARIVERDADEIRQRLDAAGEARDKESNAYTAQKMRELIDQSTGGDVVAFAQMILRRVTDGADKKRQSLEGTDHDTGL
jgi:hypothetical protein